MVLYGNDPSEAGIEESAKTQVERLTAKIQTQKKQGIDKVVLARTTSFDAVQNVLKQNTQIRELYIFTHGAPEFICLNDDVTLADGNLSKDGGNVNWLYDIQSSWSWPKNWFKYLPVPTRSFKDLDKSNCIPGGRLIIRGCNTRDVAWFMGGHLFSNQAGSNGTDDLSYRYVIKGQSFLLTKWEKRNFDWFGMGAIPY